MLRSCLYLFSPTFTLANLRKNSPLPCDDGEHNWGWISYFCLPPIIYIYNILWFGVSLGFFDPWPSAVDSQCGALGFGTPVAPSSYHWALCGTFWYLATDHPRDGSVADSGLGGATLGPASPVLHGSTGGPWASPDIPVSIAALLSLCCCYPVRNLDGVHSLIFTK